MALRFKFSENPERPEISTKSVLRSYPNRLGDCDPIYAVNAAFIAVQLRKGGLHIFSRNLGALSKF
jgi:hypothetical protein